MLQNTNCLNSVIYKLLFFFKDAIFEQLSFELFKIYIFHNGKTISIIMEM